jgi:general stress protein YciG
MAGTTAGGKKIEATMIEKLGSEKAYKAWRSEVGRLGGQKSRGGGFTGDSERAREAGRKSWVARRAA